SSPALLNRAMVANEMAIAQTLSYASWLDYFATASDNFGANAADVNFFLLPNPHVAWLDTVYGGTAFAAAYFGGRTVHAYGDDFIAAAGALITVHDAAVQALALAQQAVQAELAGGVRQQ